MAKRTMIFYGIPAYGHIHSNLYLAHCLVEEGFRIIYYSLEPFQELIEANGCEYRSYPIEQAALDLSDGRRILKLYRLILQYTWEMLPDLLDEAERENPCGVILDSLALWGRAVGFLRCVPVFSFYSIAAIDPARGKGFLDYVPGFAKDFWRYMGEVPKALHIRRQLKRNYRLNSLSLLSVLMNKGDCNLMGYSRSFQPGGDRFGEEYLFLGSLSVYRTVVKTNDFICPEGTMIYISMGTIFNWDKKLLKAVVEQFGRDQEDGGTFRYQVVMVGNTKTVESDVIFPPNFIIRPFVDQNEVLKRASLFITAGGMNSIHEALYYGVPCLLCPQQGEQLLNAKRFEKMGFGKILKNPDALREEAEKTMKLKYRWDENRRKEMIAVHMEKALKLFRGLKEDIYEGG